MAKQESSTGTVIPTQTANHYSLSGGGIHLEYDSTSLSGQPVFNYHDQMKILSFSGDQIRTLEVADIGTIISVTLNITVDIWSTSFSLLLPRVTVSGIGGIRTSKPMV